MAGPNAEEALRTLDQELERGRPLIAAASNIEALDEAEIAVLGRRSAFSAVQRALGTLPDDDRKRVGQRTNEVREALRRALAARRAELEAEWYNFDALNIPPDHTARTMMDTTFLDLPEHPELLLRTHTSPMQIRTMEAGQPPVYVVVPGRVFRNEEITAKNMPVFHQVEGLAVDEGITFADLKGTLETFYRALLGPERRIRLTPSFFPFVEPGAQVEVSCFVCGGEGCRGCGHTGWIEAAGAGMVHPVVLENVGYDSERYTGFAFGMGYDRLAMIRFGIPDIRLLWESDVRFLEQFAGQG